MHDYGIKNRYISEIVAVISYIDGLEQERRNVFLALTHRYIMAILVMGRSEHEPQNTFWETRFHICRNQIYWTYQRYPTNRLYRTHTCSMSHKGNICSSIAHYSEVMMGTMASQITSVLIVCSAVCPGADQRKHQSSLAFVRGIHRWPVDCPHKGPVTRKMFPFDNVIMSPGNCLSIRYIYCKLM